MPEAPRTGRAAISPQVAVAQGRIITIAFMGGVAMLAVVAGLIGPLQPDPGLATVLRGVLIALALVAAVGSPIARKTSLRSAARSLTGASDTETSRQAAAGGYLSQLIVGNALIESVGILGGTTYLLTGDIGGLLFAGAAVAVLATRLPTTDRFDQFAEEARTAAR